MSDRLDHPNLPCIRKSHRQGMPQCDQLRRGNRTVEVVGGMAPRKTYTHLRLDLSRHAHRNHMMGCSRVDQDVHPLTMRKGKDTSVRTDTELQECPRNNH